MPHPLLEGLDALVGAPLRERLVKARELALAASAGDTAHPAHVTLMAQQALVAAAMRAAVEAVVAALPEAAAPTPAQPAAAPTPRPAPMRPVPAPGPAAAAPAPSRLGALRRAPVEDGPPEQPEPATAKPAWQPPPPPKPQLGWPTIQLPDDGAPRRRMPMGKKLPHKLDKAPPPLDPDDVHIPW
ncbi:hypothetical protein LPC10_08380 [Methylorubrum sp. B1-46]|uniref:hypothetical protein n=1 Tax=Methylorubrum sp. B1-46 TaxID=2897334 RepID=UPI001E4EFBFD|nr:hypothetical protein [Methylorubrum sp. B1-46]UGB27565.1 hypothetical protein LPC10_08380 [Methylorubrum sp. B1-46]